MAAGEGGLADFRIRPLRGLAEFDKTVELQKEIWGFADIDAVPSRLVLVSSRTEQPIEWLFLPVLSESSICQAPKSHPAWSVPRHENVSSKTPDCDSRCRSQTAIQTEDRDLRYERRWADL